MYCPNCGTKSFKVNYCPSCGSNLQSVEKVETKAYISSYDSPTIVAKSADKKIHKNIVLVDHLPLLIVVMLIFFVVFGLFVYVLI